MDISEVAKASGIPASALRYYEEKALIQSTGRIGIRRQFAASVLTRLALVTLGQQAGFSLEDIAVMLNTAEEQINREKLLEKASDIEQQIRELGAIRDAYCMQQHVRQNIIWIARSFSSCCTLRGNAGCGELGDQESESVMILTLVDF